MGFRDEECVVYGLYSSLSVGDIRYIGISNDVNKRLVNHVGKAHLRLTYKDNWIMSEVDKGAEISATIIEVCKDRNTALKREVYWLREIGKSNKLTNLTVGGDGGMRMSESTRRKSISKVRKRRAESRFADGKYFGVFKHGNRFKTMIRDCGKYIFTYEGISAYHCAIMRDKFVIDNGIDTPLNFDDALDRFAAESSFLLKSTGEKSKVLGPKKGKKYKGVCFDKSRGLFMASIDGMNLGRYKDEKGAALAYDAAAYKARGVDTYFNFPEIIKKGVDFDGK